MFGEHIPKPLEKKHRKDEAMLNVMMNQIFYEILN